MIADVYAIIVYRNRVDWKRLIELFPWILVGLGIGYFTLMTIEEKHLKMLVGFMLLLFITFIIFKRSRPSQDLNLTNDKHSLVTISFGIFGGFSTTVANAGGEVMSIYLLLQRFPKTLFVGTVAYFFFFLNWLKFPLYWQLGLLNIEMLKITLCLSLFIVLGAFIGQHILPRIKQEKFNQFILFLSFLGAIHLFLTFG